MVYITERVRNAFDNFYTGCTGASERLKRGVLAIGQEGSRILYDIYSLDGFEKWSKVLIADLKMASLIPKLNGIFAECLKTLEAQKDLYYATQIINSMRSFIDPTGKNFRCPGFSKVLIAIGSVFETGSFLQKYKVMSFPACSAFAQELGSMRMSLFGRPDIRFDNIPVFNSFCDKPKDFFIFWASFWDVKTWVIERVYSEEASSSWESYFKLAGNMGKMLLIGGSRWLGAGWPLAIVDVATQNASLIAFIIKRHVDREKKFYASAA